MPLTSLLVAAAIAAGCGVQGDYEEARSRMVREHLEARDIRDPDVLRAMAAVPRHAFVPAVQRPLAYADHPLPIGSGQTISQPYIVALMTQLAELEPDDVVLEIGTGSGYQAAVLAEIVERVYSVEIVPELGEEAAARLAELGYDAVSVRIGDGYEGWAAHAPYDAILVTAAPPSVPEALVAQLRPGGVLVIPVGPTGAIQELRRIRKDPRDGSTSTEDIIPVRFVPMVRGR